MQRHPDAADRLERDLAGVIDVGHRVRPSITPDDPEAVHRILREHLAARP